VIPGAEVIIKLTVSEELGTIWTTNQALRNAGPIKRGPSTNGLMAAGVAK
jgi:hypothetical protein